MLYINNSVHSPIINIKYIAGRCSAILTCAEQNEQWLEMGFQNYRIETKPANSAVVFSGFTVILCKVRRGN